jgi:hypothetical protein
LKQEIAMKKLMLPLALVAVLALPAAANASPCRNAKGQFAKCGTPGAMPAGGKAAPAMKPAGPAMAPAMAPAMKPAAPAPAMKPAAPAMKPAAAPAMAPAMAPAKKGPCKDAKGKFIKC